MLLLDRGICLAGEDQEGLIVLSGLGCVRLMNWPGMEDEEEMW